MTALREALHDGVELALTLATDPVDRRERVHAAIEAALATPSTEGLREAYIAALVTAWEQAHWVGARTGENAVGIVSNIEDRFKEFVPDWREASAEAARIAPDRAATPTAPSTEGHTHDPERVECLPPHGAGAHNRCPRCGGYYFRCEDPYHDAATPSTEDDPMLDGTDGAHPAWWRGHDHAAARLAATPSTEGLRERPGHTTLGEWPILAATPTEHPAGLEGLTWQLVEAAMHDVGEEQGADPACPQLYPSDAPAIARRIRARLSDRPTETGEQG